MKVLVVIPTYNEVQNLPELLKRILALKMDGLGVLIIDDNSPDGTGKMADEWAMRHPAQIEVMHRQKKEGLAAAYVQGFHYALERGAEAIVQMDADLSHSPEDIPRFLEAISRCDVVVGSRYVPGGRVDPNWSLLRRFISRMGGLYACWVTGLRVEDATTGFRCFRKKALESLDLRKIESKGFAFQVEVLYYCQKKGLHIEEIPIFFPDRVRGMSKMSLKIFFEALWRVWKIRWKY